MADSQLPTKSHRLLRERRKLDLSIIPISYREWNKVYDCNCELVLEPDDEENTEGDQEQPTPPPSPTPSLIEDTHLVEVMEGLYIALADDEADVCALRTFDNEQFTHVVQVSYVPPPGGDDVLALSNWRREEASRNALVQRLCLVCPATSFRFRAEQTAVSPKGLYAARDFLSLALPHGNTKWWPEELRKNGGEHPSGYDILDAIKGRAGQDDKDGDGDAQFVFLAPDILGLDELMNEDVDRVEQDDNVNVLIVAPPSRAVDVLSVLLCYLVFLEDTMPEDLLDMLRYGALWEDVTLGSWTMRWLDVIARQHELDAL